MAYGLRTGVWEGTGRGFADFVPLEPGSWLDAMNRLRWLEAITLEINRSVKERIAKEWGRYEDALREAASRCTNPEEIAELPDIVEIPGPKRRRSGVYL